MRRLVSCGAAVVSVALVLAGHSLTVAAAEAGPLVLSHEGMLLDADGYPVDATKYVTFQLYDAASGGTLIWWETHQVSSVSGYYQVFLGSADAQYTSGPLTTDIFDKSDLWLGVTVGDSLDVEHKVVGTELAPRQRFGSVPFALRAYVALDAVGDIHPSSVTTSQITATNLTIADGGTLTLANGAVLSGSLPADTIGASQITNGSITLDDLSEELKATLQGWCGSSTTNTISCDTGYISVPASTLPDGTSVPAFCVMKYEVKNDGNGNPVSVAGGTPWVDITWTDAKAKCEAIGKHLISENQWLSIAHNVVNVASNWTSGTVGTGSLFRGHSDSSPDNALEASTDDSDGYYGTGDSASSGAEQKRTLTLPNGEVIWDLAGNLWEWVDETIPAADRYHGGSSEWMSYSSATDVPSVKRPPNGWNENQGMGKYYDGASTLGAYNNVSDPAVDNGCTDYCAPTTAFVRGGHWYNGAYAGVFTLSLNNGRAAQGTGIGWRCAYTPVGAPQNLAATGGVGQVVLTWEAPTLTGGAAITGYKIYRGTAPSPTTLVATVGDVLTWTDPDVVAGVTYHYRVKAVNADGAESGYSTDASATPTALTCDTGYIPVPASTLPDGTSVPAFCVMKYEAKDDGNGNPVSVAAGTPWVNITWTDAKAKCEAIGKHMISENQWLSIAHNVVYVDSNWTGGTVGSGSLFRGHSDNSPGNALAASTDDNDGYLGTGNSAPSEQRRTLTLSNGEVIWDLAGNVWEWVDETIPIGDRYHGGAQQWMSYHSDDGTGKVASSMPSAKLPPNEWNADQGMGRYYDGWSTSGAYNNVNEAPDYCTGTCAPTAAFRRGGVWSIGAVAGVFSLYLNNGRAYQSTNVGWRCAE